MKTSALMAFTCSGEKPLKFLTEWSIFAADPIQFGEGDSFSYGACNAFGVKASNRWRLRYRRIRCQPVVAARTSQAARPDSRTQLEATILVRGDKMREPRARWLQRLGSPLARQSRTIRASRTRPSAPKRTTSHSESMRTMPRSGPSR